MFSPFLSVSRHCADVCVGVGHIVGVTHPPSQEGNPPCFPYGFATRPIAAASWKRERIPSLWYALERWRSIVFSVTNSAWAISRLVCPSAA